MAVALAVPALAFAADSGRPRVLAIHYVLEVNPVTSSYLDHQLHRAQKDGYDAAVIVLDTPGGLSESMRTIVKTELSLEDPGDRLRRRRRVREPPRPACGSRQAADVARDGTGDQHRLLDADQRQAAPNLGCDLRRKVLNDAAASLREPRRVPRPQRRLGRPGRTQGLEPRRPSRPCEMNVIDDIAPERCRRS